MGAANGYVVTQRALGAALRHVVWGPKVGPFWPQWSFNHRARNGRHGLTPVAPNYATPQACSEHLKRLFRDPIPPLRRQFVHANLHCPRYRDSLVSRLYFRSILGAHCITEFKAKNRPPAVSTATSAPHEPNLHVVPVGFVEIGYKLTPCPLIPNLGI